MCNQTSTNYKLMQSLFDVSRVENALEGFSFPFICWNIVTNLQLL